MFKARHTRFGGRGVSTGGITNADLANMAEGTAKLRALGSGTGAPVDGTGAQLGAITQFSGFTGSVISAGTYDNHVVATGVRLLDVDPTGTVNFTGFAHADGNAGRFLVIGKFGADGQVVIKHNTGSSASNLVFTPDGKDYVLEKQLDMVLLWYFNTRWQVVDRLILPSALAGVTSSLAVPFLIYVDCPSGGAAGTADDVTIPVQTFAYRILDAQLRVSTAVALSSAALRTASGGGGTVVLPDPAIATQTFSTATAGVLEDLATATATVAASATRFLRRSDRSVVGELVLTCIRT